MGLFDNVKKTASTVVGAGAAAAGIAGGIAAAGAAKEFLDDAGESVQGLFGNIDQTIREARDTAGNTEEMTGDMAEVTEAISKPFEVINRATDFIEGRIEFGGEDVAEQLESPIPSISDIPMPDLPDVGQLEPHIPVPELPSVVEQVPEVISDPGNALEDLGISFS